MQPKLWYIASFFHPLNSHISQIKAEMTRFVWDRGKLRVPAQTLALPLNKGGLGLDMPELKSKALLINRYIREKESTSFSKSAIESLNNPPHITITNLPCIKSIIKEAAYLPIQL